MIFASVQVQARVEKTFPPATAASSRSTIPGSASVRLAVASPCAALCTT